jgi:hypothetical protein
VTPAPGAAAGRATPARSRISALVLVPATEERGVLLPEFPRDRQANETHFRIGKTAFTTITTNVNFQTTVHTDKGDDAEGFAVLPRRWGGRAHVWLVDETTAAGARLRMHRNQCGGDDPVGLV